MGVVRGTAEGQRAKSCYLEPDLDNVMYIKDADPPASLDEYIGILDPVNDSDGPYSAGNSNNMAHVRATVSDGTVYSVDLMKCALMFIQGHSRSSIAASMNVSKKAIEITMGSAQFRALKDSLAGNIVATARTFMTGATIKATQTLINLLDSENDKIKLQAATEILNRVGLKTPDQIEVLQTATKMHSMSKEQLMDFIQLGMKELTHGDYDESPE